MKTTSQNPLNSNKNYAIQLTILLTLLGWHIQAKSSFYTVETNRIWINVTDTQGAFSQTLMGYRSGATDGVDHGLDGAYMNDGAIALASLIGDVRYVIQFKGLPFSTDDVIPLSFSASYNGTYSFAIDHMDGFFANSTLAVYLHDKVTNTYNNLKMGGYTFIADAGMYNNRFELTYSQPLNALGTNQNAFNASNLDIYQNNRNLVLNAGDTLLKNIAIYSINGQLLYQNKQVNASLYTINAVSLSQQPIIIKITTRDGITLTKKWRYL